MTRFPSAGSLKPGTWSPAHHVELTGASGNVPYRPSNVARAESMGTSATDFTPNSP
ncbi:MAG TPA: hypothetical protein VF720_04935 [Candidatus Eisenbacteria bacterium]